MAKADVSIFLQQKNIEQVANDMNSVQDLKLHVWLNNKNYIYNKSHPFR